jgi:NAD-dependent SIR2 family protein deacetylase
MLVNDYKEVANLIKKSKTTLFLTGAGMSADSGIPTFRDKEGYWRNFPVFKEKGLEAQELASPYSFEVRPAYAWAFYEWRRRNAHKNKPHEGYYVIVRLMKEVFESSFIHTTNTDGYHLRSGAPNESVYEVHGSMWRLQCMRGLACSYYVQENYDVPLCSLDETTMQASNLPYCPVCGSLLRPNILMFGDWDYIENEYQANNYYTFLNNCKYPDIVFLIGSSGAVPTNDYVANKLKFYGSKIITINPVKESTHICQPHIFLQDTAKNALTKIESMVF